jgi:hypothetical protein
MFFSRSSSLIAFFQRQKEYNGVAKEDHSLDICDYLFC